MKSEQCNAYVRHGDINERWLFTEIITCINQNLQKQNKNMQSYQLKINIINRALICNSDYVTL